MTTIKYFFTLLVLTNFLFNCASSQSHNDINPEVTQDLDKSLSFKTTQNVAVNALIDQALQETSEGLHDQASSTLERALRLAPQAPEPHYHLAKIRFGSGQTQSALGIALKGKSLLTVQSSRTLRQAFWQLIDECNAQLGREDKADEVFNDGQS